MVERQYIEAWVNAGEIIESKIEKLRVADTKNGDPEQAFKRIYYNIANVTDAEIKNILQVLKKKRSNLSDLKVKNALGDFITNAELSLLTATQRSEAVKLMRSENILPNNEAEQERQRLIEEHRRSQEEARRKHEEEQRRRAEEERRRVEEEHRRAEEERRRKAQEEEQRRRRAEEENNRRRANEVASINDWVLQAAEQRRLFVESKKKKGKWKSPLKWILGILIVIGAGWGIYKLLPMIGDITSSKRPHHLISEQALLRSTAKIEKDNAIATLKFGDKLLVDEEQVNVWSYVTLSDTNLVGYVASNVIVPHETWAKLETVFELSQDGEVKENEVLKAAPNDDFRMAIAKYLESEEMWGCCNDSIENIYEANFTDNVRHVKYVQSTTRYKHYNLRNIGSDYFAFIVNDLDSAKRKTLVFSNAGDGDTGLFHSEDAPISGGITKIRLLYSGKLKIEYEKVKATSTVKNKKSKKATAKKETTAKKEVAAKKEVVDEDETVEVQMQSAETQNKGMQEQPTVHEETVKTEAPSASKGSDESNGL